MVARAMGVTECVLDLVGADFGDQVDALENGR
jgi:hypothetical protein